MAVDTSNLKTAFRNVLDKAKADSLDDGNSEEQIRQDFADGIADALETWLGTATITFNPGEIQVQGSPAAQSNVSILSVTGAIS